MRPAVTLSSNEVARVADRPVSVARFESELARRGPGTPPADVLGSLVSFEATLIRARAAGFDRDPEVVRAIEQLLVSRYEEREAPDVEAPPVSDEEIRAAYDAHPERYTIPPAVRGAVILLRLSSKAGPEQRAALLQRAEALRAESVAGDQAVRERLTRENSDDQASRYHGGDTGWLTAGGAIVSWEPAIVEALSKLSQPGDHAPVIETPRGLHIVRLVATRPAAVRPLAEVRDALRHQLQLGKRAQRREDFRLRMLAGLDIRTNTPVWERLLAAPRTESGTLPPALP